MNVSIIVPTYNAEVYLPALLASLKNQTIAHELIIIDSSSTDKTLEIAQGYTEHIIRIPKSQFDHGGTRTQAAKVASGEIVIFLTQDAMPTENTTIATLLEAFKNPQVGMAFGRQLPYESTNLFGQHLRSFNYPAVSYTRTLSDKTRYGMKTAFLSDSFSAYRKSALIEVDYFKDGLIFGEDNHITAKLLLQGYQLCYVAEAMVYHSHSYTPKEEFQRYFDTGVFHRKEQWILDTFGKAEGEGAKYVKSELAYILQKKAYPKLPEFVLRNGFKYLGYTLGRHYGKLPQSIINKCSMHTSWWKQNHDS